MIIKIVNIKKIIFPSIKKIPKKYKSKKMYIGFLVIEYIPEVFNSPGLFSSIPNLHEFPRSLIPQIYIIKLRIIKNIPIIFIK